MPYAFVNHHAVAFPQRADYVPERYRLHVPPTFTFRCRTDAHLISFQDPIPGSSATATYKPDTITFMTYLLAFTATPLPHHSSF